MLKLLLSVPTLAFDSQSLVLSILLLSETKFVWGIKDGMCVKKISEFFVKNS